jgi:hypothetical protein
MALWQLFLIERQDQLPAKNCFEPSGLPSAVFQGKPLPN